MNQRAAVQALQGMAFSKTMYNGCRCLLTEQGSHSDGKTWENGKAFSSWVILNRIEKSGKITLNPGKPREFQRNVI